MQLMPDTKAALTLSQRSERYQAAQSAIRQHWRRYFSSDSCQERDACRLDLSQLESNLPLSGLTEIYQNLQEERSVIAATAEVPDALGLKQQLGVVQKVRNFFFAQFAQLYAAGM